MTAGQFMKTFASIAAFAAAGALAGCSGLEGDGVPLSELDLTGEAPGAVTLFGPDRVIITEGAPFRVTAEGESSEQLRFSLRNGTLGVSRDPSLRGSWGGEPATVRITMPAPRNLSVAGSGRMTSSTLASEAEVSIAGSGALETPQVDVQDLAITIAGSGDHIAGGRASSLKVSIAGSGNARLERLKADKAEVNVAGSGNVAFASDGEVNARILGSGDVTVSGSARCKVNAIGSGSVKCGAAPATESAG